MNFAASLLFLFLLLDQQVADAFQPAPFFGRVGVLVEHQTTASSVSRHQPSLIPRWSDADDEEEKPYENPYQDPNYPDLEFVDYSDPEYVVDQGVGDEFFSGAATASSTASDQTEEEIEAMREDRRRRNDEFQFETYFESILKNGDEFCGEWSLYKTSTFMGDDTPDMEGGLPRVIRARHPLKVKSRAYKIQIETDSDMRVDGEAICHEEIPVKEERENESPQQQAIETEIMANRYAPDQLKALDFRGWQGIMCVGAAHTISTAKPLLENHPKEEGPYETMKAELGITENDLKMRVKFDYSVKEDEKNAFLKNPSSNVPPPLYLKSMTVCREARGRWPNNGMGDAMLSEQDLIESEALFGIPGAQNGLYDPPPVGSDAQAGQYMTLDLEGGATVLFPYLVDQDPDAFGGYGWVTSLDWTPGAMRYQVDRKVKGGKDLLGLRTLELSEVQSADAETYRPKDGGSNMNQ